MSCFQVIYESFSCSCFAFTLWLLPLFNLYLVVFFISRGSCLFISLRLFEYNAIFTYSYMYEMCFWIYLIYVKSHLLLFCFFFFTERFWKLFPEFIPLNLYCICYFIFVTLITIWDLPEGVASAILYRGDCCQRLVMPENISLSGCLTPSLCWD